jgi:hypothetical protein
MDASYNQNTDENWLLGQASQQGVHRSREANAVSGAPRQTARQRRLLHATPCTIFLLLCFIISTHLAA